MTTDAFGEPVATALAAPPAGWRAPLTGLPGPFWFLWGGTLLNRLGSFVVPFLALYLTGARGFSVAEAGVVLTLFGLGSAVSQPFGGALADRYGRRRTMVGGLTGAAAALLVLGAVSSPVALGAAALLYGACLDVYRPASQAAIADLVPERDRPRAFALVFWAINLGFSVATPLGGFLASRGYWLLFVLDAAACLAFAVLILRGVPETRPVHTGAPGRSRDVLRDGLLLALVAASVLQAMAYMQSFVTLPLVFDADGLGPAAYGLAIGLNGVMIVVLQPLLLGAVGRRDRGTVLLVAMALQGAGFGAHALADDVGGHVAAIAVWTVGEVLAAGLLGTLVAALAPPHLRGRYMGAFGFSFGAAAFLAPLVGTQVLSRLGEDALWGGALAASLVAGVALHRVAAAADRRARATAAAVPEPAA